MRTSPRDPANSSFVLVRYAEVITAAMIKLCEYRAALISATVTGQLDIRKHEKQLEALA